MYRSRGRVVGKDVCPLSFVETGEEAVIVDVQAGRGLIGRLLHMGIYPGTRIRVISNNVHGPVIIGIGEKRIGLGRGMCNKIIVRRLGL